MGKTHSEVINGFAMGKEYYGSRVFANNGVLYSFGIHFPLAVKRRTEEGNVWFLLNGDKYSPTTSGHQAMTYRVFQNEPRVSFTAINAAGINYGTVELIDFTKDLYDCIYIGNDGFEDFKSKMPVGAEYHEKKDKDGEVISKSYHRVGSVVLKQDDK